MWLVAVNMNISGQSCVLSGTGKVARLPIPRDARKPGYPSFPDQTSLENTLNEKVFRCLEADNQDGSRLDPDVDCGFCQ
jgi:hypothetical protein